MRPEAWPRVRALFEQALDLQGAERDQFVAAATAGDAELAQQVRSLLLADAGPPHAVALIEGGSRALLPIPQIGGGAIAGFEIVRQIGVGGMGVVYEAHQQRPQRVVALKTLTLRFPSERAQRRFEDESDIVARLDHPAIAQVLQAGTARVGGQDVPWFAMELVEAPLPIDRWVKEQSLDAYGIAALLATVCDAVHHAHQRGVIHRDLKPANVLVDRRGRVKVIDFGIARFADDQTRRTRTGEILGTVAYMSPERLERAGAGDDTAADVYSLGVILYELLAGCSPLPIDGLPPAQALEMLRAGDPAPPSRVNPAVPVDLGCVALKAMAREPARRYQSAAELREDLDRFLRREPVRAGAPSAAYRLRRLAWRHRVLLGTAATLAAAVTAGFVVAMVGWWRVGAAERLASRRAAVLSEVNRFHEDVLGSIYGAEHGREIRLKEVVDGVAQRLQDKHFSDPVVEIGLRTAMGRSYLGLGRLAEAEQQLLRARCLLADHSEAEPSWTVLVAGNLATVYEAMGKLDLAERENRTALAGRIALFGAEHPDTAVGRSNLASTLIKRGAFAEALELATLAQRRFEQRFGRASEQSVNALVAIGLALRGMGRGEESQSTLADARAMADAQLDPDHPARLAVLSAQSSTSLGACEELVAVHERVSGTTHPKTLIARNNLAAAQAVRGQHAVAETTYRDILAAWSAQGIEDGFDRVVAAQGLTRVVRLQGRTAEAEAMACQLRATAATSLPAGHWLCGVVAKEHGGCLRELERFEEAETTLLEAYALLERAVGPGDHRTQRVVDELISLYAACSRPADLARWRALQVRRD